MLNLIKYIILLVSCGVVFVQSELFTSMAHLERALWAEKDIADELRQYVSREEERLQKIRRIADDLETHSDQALVKPESHLANPVSAFLFTKRFTLDWERDIDSLLKSNDNIQDISDRIEYLKQDLPTHEDLNGAVAALLRLQDTYQLKTENIASGNVGGVKTSTLTASDCFELGRIAYNTEDYYHTVLWMDEAIMKITRERNETMERREILDYLSFSLYKGVSILSIMKTLSDVLPLGHLHKRPIDWFLLSPWSPKSQNPDTLTDECFEIGKNAYMQEDFYHTLMWLQEALMKDYSEVNKTASRHDVLDYLSYATLMQGNVRHALTLTDELLLISPDHSRAKNNKAYYEKLLSEEPLGHGQEEEVGESSVRNPRKLDEYRDSEEFYTYEALCRGEETQPIKDAHRLKCYYLTNENPLLLLQPVKVEEAHLDPWIVMFHDIMNTKEMVTIKGLATPKLGRATVHNSLTGKLETATYRTSKSAWLRSIDHPVIARINTRIDAITGLELETAEELQVANYGIGGHYEPHFDFARKEETHAFKSLGTGNRIATWLTYMTDVEAGGATVFPHIGVKIFPEKGAAAFWYNLNRSGDGIFNTRHAACPVLVGTKWVSNKWIHERGQEFRRPCSLQNDE